jgi:glyoxylase-like metal-dependent hydrolase (beta-lactamase superfamily II)
MPAFICATCGTQFPPADAAPAACPICQDERQYVGAGGQRWTTLEAMRRTHLNAWRMHEPNLIGIGTTPAFAIAQRALLLRRGDGNILWDCITFIDDATVELVKALGGIRAIAISHPHYYSCMVEWAHAFGAEIWLHEGDRAHVMRPDPAIRFWGGATQALAPGVTLVNAPGHYEGGTMLHWADGAEGRGALLSGDIIQVVPDSRHVSFMRSYPNLIPLNARTVRAIAAAVAPYAYERIYGAWWDRIVARDAKARVANSVARYLRWIAD